VHYINSIEMTNEYQNSHVCELDLDHLFIFYFAKVQLKKIKLGLFSSVLLV